MRATVQRGMTERDRVDLQIVRIRARVEKVKSDDFSAWSVSQSVADLEWLMYQLNTALTKLDAR